MNFDTSLLHYVIQLRRPWLDDVMILASALGAAGFIWWVFAVIAGVFSHLRPAAYRLVLSLLFTFLLNDYVLKPIFNRTRPFYAIAGLSVIDARPVTASFPSGHAAMAMAGAIAGSRMLPLAAWVLWPLGVIVAVSRVYVGVHWPTDVIAGALVGIVCAWFVLGGRRPRGGNPVLSSAEGRRAKAEGSPAAPRG